MTLTKKQVAELENKNWKVKPKGFRLTLYKADFMAITWIEMCNIAGVDPESDSFTTVSFGTIEE